MIAVSYWQIIIYTLAVFVGVYIIVELRIKQNNDTVSAFIGLQNDKVKKILTKLVDETFDTFDKIENRFAELEEKNGRNN